MNTNDMIVSLCILFMLIGNLIYVISFLSLRVQKKTAALIMSVLAIFTIIGQYLLSFVYENQMALMNCFFMPVISFGIFFFMSKYRDARFVFHLSVIELMSVCVFISSECISLLLGDDATVQLFIEVIFFMITYVALKVSVAKWNTLMEEMKKGWGTLSAIALLSLATVILVAYYPTPIRNRTIYILPCMVVCILISMTLVCFIWTLSKVHELNELKKEVELQKSALKLQEAYEKMAYTDIMTDLNNRASFEKELVHLGNLEHLNVTVISIDLNNLKKINDGQGHHAGDEFIQEAANVLKETFGEIGNIYRIGGDEFVVILQQAQKQQVDEKIELLQTCLENSKNELLSMAVGVAELKNGENMQELLERADERMYEDKTEYKKKFYYYGR